MGLLILLGISLRTPKEIVDPYYPKSAFKIPLDVQKERIATVSATSVRLPILMYHYVEVVQDPGDITRIKMNVGPAYFEHQIQSLKNAGYRTIFMRSIPEIISGARLPPPKTIALTFDDGYEDFYYYVFPLLKKYQLNATIYVMYNYLGRRGYLTIPQIKEMIASGLVELGSHTLDHASLPAESSNQAWKEIFDNKIKLEATFGVAVPSFAYPYGAFSSNILALTKKAGYTNAVSVIPGINQSEDNLFYLSRLRPGVLWGTNPVKTLESYSQK